MINKKEISNRIIWLREKKFKSNQLKCSEFLGMKYTTYRGYEAGTSGKLSVYESICEKYEVNTHWLLTGEGPIEKGNHTVNEREGVTYGIQVGSEDDLEFAQIPLKSGHISAGGGLEADNNSEIKIAFRKDWISRKGSPENMSLIKVHGDSMEPTLASGDMVLVDHGHQRVDNYGGLYAISSRSNDIYVKRLHLSDATGKVKIISDNPTYEPIEIEPSELIINGKIIWFCREIER